MMSIRLRLLRSFSTGELVSTVTKCLLPCKNFSTRAMELHQTGQIGPAARLYQQILAQDEENADALHLLGVLRHQQGDHAQAVTLIGRAVAMRPNIAAFHANLAEAYRGWVSSNGRPAAVAQPCVWPRIIPRRTATSAWRCKGWAGTPRPSNISVRPCNCSRTWPWHTAISASVCGRLASRRTRAIHFRRAALLDPKSPLPRPSRAQHSPVHLSGLLHCRQKLLRSRSQNCRRYLKCLIGPCQFNAPLQLRMPLHKVFNVRCLCRLPDEIRFSAAEPARTRKPTPSPVAAWLVILASWPPPTMPTTRHPGRRAAALNAAGGAHSRNRSRSVPYGTSAGAGGRDVTQLFRLRSMFSAAKHCIDFRAAFMGVKPLRSCPTGGSAHGDTGSGRHTQRRRRSGRPRPRGQHGTQVIAVEPGGAEFIPLNERHGQPLQLSGPGPRRTWSSPRSSSACSRSRDSAWVLGGGAGPHPGQRDRRHHPGDPVHARTEVRGAADGTEPAGVRLLGQRAARRAELGHGRDRLVRGEQRQRRLRAERPDPHAAGALPAHHRGGAGRGGVLRLQPGARLRAVRLPHPHRHLPDRGRRHPEQGPPGRAPQHHPRRVPADAGCVVRVRGGLEPVRV